MHRQSAENPGNVDSIHKREKTAEKMPRKWSKPKLNKTVRLLKLRLKPIANCIEFEVLFHRQKLQGFLKFALKPSILSVLDP